MWKEWISDVDFTSAQCCLFLCSSLYPLYMCGWYQNDVLESGWLVSSLEWITYIIQDTVKNHEKFLVKIINEQNSLFWRKNDFGKRDIFWEIFSWTLQCMTM